MGESIGKPEENHGNMEVYRLVNKQFASENGHLQLIYTLNMVIFHTYVSSPEGSIVVVYSMAVLGKLVEGKTVTDRNWLVSQQKWPQKLFLT